MPTTCWEKGIVEKNAQESRRRIWLDAQDCMFHTFEELNAWLGQRCRALWGELLHPQYNPLTVANVLELERAELMPIPTVFDGYVERTVRVSSTCLSAWMPLRRATTETLCPSSRRSPTMAGFCSGLQR